MIRKKKNSMYDSNEIEGIYIPLNNYSQDKMPEPMEQKVKPIIKLYPTSTKYSQIDLRNSYSVYKCDEENNPPDMLENNIIISEIYVYKNNNFNIFNLSNILTYILQDMSINRDMVTKIGKLFYLDLIELDFFNNIKFQEEWELSMLNLFIQKLPEIHNKDINLNLYLKNLLKKIY